jgi:hypothetical protein
MIIRYQRALLALRQAHDESEKAISTAITLLTSFCSRFQESAQAIASIDAVIPPVSEVSIPEPILTAFTQQLFLEFAAIPALGEIVRSEFLPHITHAHAAYAALTPTSSVQSSIKRMEAASAKCDSARARYEKACRNIEDMHRKKKGDFATLLIELRPLQNTVIEAFNELNAVRQALNLEFERELYEFEKADRNLNEEIQKRMNELAISLGVIIVHYQMLAVNLRDGLELLAHRIEIEESLRKQRRRDRTVSVTFEEPILDFDVTKMPDIDVRKLFEEELRKASGKIVGVDGIVTVLDERDRILTVELPDGTRMTKQPDEVEIVFRRKLAQVTEDCLPVVAGETALVTAIDGPVAQCQTVFGRVFVIPLSKLRDIQFIQ